MYRLLPFRSEEKQLYFFKFTERRNLSMVTAIAAGLFYVGCLCGGGYGIWYMLTHDGSAALAEGLVPPSTAQRRGAIIADYKPTHGRKRTTSFISISVKNES